MTHLCLPKKPDPLISIFVLISDIYLGLTAGDSEENLVSLTFMNSDMSELAEVSLLDISCCLLM